MPAWPTVAEVKAALGVDTTSRDATISAALAAAMEQVGWDLGYRAVSVSQESGEDEYILSGSTEPDGTPAEVPPTYSTSNAVLILAVMAVKAPEAPYGVAAVFDLGGLKVASEHPTYLRMLVGNRISFGIG